MTERDRPGQGGPENQNQNDAQRIEQLKRADQEMLGLQGRFLLADQEVLKPLKAENNITTISEIHNFEQRTTNKGYDSFEKSSYIDRDAYWQQQIALGNVKDAQQQPTRDKNIMLEQWINTMEQLMKNQGNRQTVQALEKVLKQTGIQKENNNAYTKEDMKKLYAHYFESEKNEKRDGIKLFVKDVLTAYQLMGNNITTDKQAALDNIYRNMNHIEWMANIFGQKNSVNMVKNLILAEAKNIVNGNELKSQLQQTTRNADNQEVMRINNLSKDERNILTHVTELPANKYEETVQYAIEHNDTLIVIGGTGSGKTTQTPQMVRELMMAEKAAGRDPGVFIITEPRQINTEELAERVAKETTSKEGKKWNGLRKQKEFGYQHGGKKVIDKDKNDTIFMTEGSLLGTIMDEGQQDFIDKLTYIMVDEIHVRSTNTEELLGRIKNINDERRRRQPPKQPIKLIAVSATVNEEDILKYFKRHFNAERSPLVKIEGMTYDVHSEFAQNEVAEGQMPDAAAKAVAEVLTTNPIGKGDIISFFAGAPDIRKAKAKIQEQINQLKQQHPELTTELDNIELVEMHSQKAERKKLESTKRHIILATNYAETGVTFENLQYVINSGEENESRVDPVTGIKYLVKIKQSKANADQRKGRVGRTGIGWCINLFTERDYLSRDPYPTPELKRTDLAVMQLKLKKKGEDLRTFPTITDLSDQESQQAITEADNRLIKIGAMEQNGSLTGIGKQIADLHMDEYHQAYIIAKAEQERIGRQEAYAIAALAPEDIISDPSKLPSELKDESSDLITYLKIWQTYVSSQMEKSDDETKNWAQNNGIDIFAIQNAKTTLLDLLENRDPEYKQILTSIQNDINEEIRQEKQQIDPRLSEDEKNQREKAIYGRKQAERRQREKEKTDQYIKQKYQTLTDQTISAMNQYIQEGYKDRVMNYKSDSAGYKPEDKQNSPLTIKINDRNSIFSRQTPAKIIAIGDARREGNTLKTSTIHRLAA